MKKRLGWVAGVVLAALLIAGFATVGNDDLPSAGFCVVSSDGEVLQALDSMRAVKSGDSAS
ncbi:MULTISPECIES: hypothetical protein [unclassified Caballeronia]|uniref:hypothetical protein n=1 Tax=unclassified Caballeronia TaxID=2646786 RepID=UPI0020280342|nr:MULTISPECIES: hypothetical protein [unclassified Caballeronia]MDR5773576.1 hypothetical protein [Caballeronia sp. LZ002]MDR5849010.1 hypothetical protein [Caballeronia sp. LZ003]